MVVSIWFYASFFFNSAQSKTTVRGRREASKTNMTKIPPIIPQTTMRELVLKEERKKALTARSERRDKNVIWSSYFQMSQTTWGSWRTTYALKNIAGKKDSKTTSFGLKSLHYSIIIIIIIITASIQKHTYHLFTAFQTLIMTHGPLAIAP